jgi:hypothetical protein
MTELAGVRLTASPNLYWTYPMLNPTAMDRIVVTDTVTRHQVYADVPGSN